MIDSEAVDVDAATKIESTPLIRAESWGHLERVRRLRKNGADVKKRNWYGQKQARKEGMAELLEPVEDVDDRDSFGRTSRHGTVSNGHLVVARQVLEKGAQRDAVDEDGATTLHVAVDSGNEVLVRELLRAGADINAPTNAGETILAWAIASDHGDRLPGVLHTVADPDGSAGAKRTLLPG
jgi:ankyrin repeat protein